MSRDQVLGLCLSLGDSPRSIWRFQFVLRKSLVSLQPQIFLRISRMWQCYKNVSWLQVDVCHLIKSTTIENIYRCSCLSVFPCIFTLHCIAEINAYSVETLFISTTFDIITRWQRLTTLPLFLFTWWEDFLKISRKCMG